MEEIRYIHCSDLQLGSPFRGIRDSFQHGLFPQNTGLRTLERLSDLCKSENPDFLVLSGNTLNLKDAGISDILALSNFCADLEDMPIFIALGNEDPWEYSLHSLKLPTNAHIFGPEYEKIPVIKDGRTIALIHGISHARHNEARNLAALFKKDPSYDCFQIGVLQCRIEGCATGELIAPCTLEDLSSSGLDAWAPGYNREQKFISRIPFIAYPGKVQGLNINEPGPGGCLLVTAKNISQGWECKADFKALNPVQWETLEINIEGINNPEKILNLAHSKTLDLLTSLDTRLEGLILRLVLTGTTSHGKKLESNDFKNSLKDEMAHLMDGNPPVFLNDIEVLIMDNSVDNQNKESFMGAIGKLAENLLSEEEDLNDFAKAALAPLYGKQKAGSLIGVPNPAMIKEMLRKACRHCCDALEEN